ncbi:glycosyltransferase, partial [Paracoccus sp. (in: a-proteobacteria)]
MRFSYLGRSDAKLARSTDDLEQRKQVLYDPERLEERF